MLPKIMGRGDMQLSKSNVIYVPHILWCPIILIISNVTDVVQYLLHIIATVLSTGWT